MILLNQADKTSRLVKDYSRVGNDWGQQCVLAYSKQEHHYQRLIDLAHKNRWSVDDFDWQQVNLHSIPVSLRQSAATMFTQLLYGEITALVGAARLVDKHHSPLVQNFLRVQLEEESRHVEWFAHLIDKLDCQAVLSDSVLALIDSVLDCDTVEGLVVGLHILIEGMAHSMFMEGARAFSKANKIASFMRPYQTAKKIVVDWMPEYLGKDESRHIAFGTQYLSHRVPELCPAKRRCLENQIESWAQLYRQAAYDPEVWPVAGLDGTAIANRCVDTINHRLKIIGFEARIQKKDN